MDLRLVICVAVVAFVAVEARSAVRCQLYCQNGYEPGSYCRCRQFPIQEINPCALKSCPRNTRCEARGRVGICVPLFPTGPIMPVDPVLPVDPVMPVDPILPIDPTLPITVCALAKETGPCKGYMPRYYYNSATGTCDEFIYGGCGGNENNFRTLLECNSRCVRQPRRNYY